MLGEVLPGLSPEFTQGDRGMRDVMMFLYSWFSLAGLVALFAYDSILPLVAFGIAMLILEGVANKLK